MTSPRLKRMPADRRRRLVDVAAAEFASAGYEDASLNHIIDRCGMSKSSFYYVLSSKAELFDLVIRQLTEDIAAHIAIPRPSTFEGSQFWRRLRQFFDDLVAASHHQPAMTLGRVFYSEAPAAATGAVNSTLAAAHAWVADVVEVGRRSGAVRDDLPAALQVDLVFRVVQVFDEWTLRHLDEFGAAEVTSLADAQFAALRRLLAP